MEATIREVIPARELATIVDNIGVPYSGINTAYSSSAPIGSGDADILVNLTEHHQPTINYVRKLRARLNELYPSTTFAFLPADIVSQILNFGLPAPLDVQVSGFNVNANRAYASDLLARMHKIPGIVDLRIQQAYDYPTLNVDVDRSKAALLGLTETDVAGEHADLALGQRPDAAVVLDRPEDRHTVPGGRTDARSFASQLSRT